jgi:hypothetical protein
MDAIQCYEVLWLLESLISWHSIQTSIKNIDDFRGNNHRSNSSMISGPLKAEIELNVPQLSILLTIGLWSYDRCTLCTAKVGNLLLESH